MKHLTLRTLQCLALLGSTALGLPALAQDEQQLDTAEPVSAETTATNQNKMPMPFTAGWTHQFNTHVDGGGNFSIDRFRLGLGLPIQLNDQFFIATVVKYQVDSYNFGGGISPWENIETFTAVGLLQYRADDHWLWYGGPIMRSAMESGVNWGNATRGGGVLAVNYFADSNLSFGGGLLVMGQLEDNALVLPIVTVNWKFADDWRLKVGFTDLATAGYGIDAVWDCAPDWQLTFGGAFHKSRFRIEGSGPTADGIGQEKSFTLSAAATWVPNKTFCATAFVGLATGGKLRVEDSSGNELSESDYDTAPIFGVNAKVKF